MLRIITIVFIFLFSNVYSLTTQNHDFINIKIENNKLKQENSNLKNKLKLHFDSLAKMKNENILFKKLISSDFKNLEITLKQKNDNLNNLLNQYKINETNFNDTLTLYYWISLIGFALLIAFGIYKATGIYKLKKEVDSYKEENLNPMIETIKARQEAIVVTQTSIINSLSSLNHYENKIQDIYKITEDERIGIMTKLTPLEENLGTLIQILKEKNVLEDADIEININDNLTNDNNNQSSEFLE